MGSLFETSGARETKYIFLGGTRVASVTKSPVLGSSVLYYHSDHLGGANVLTDATGFKKELIEYEPFGLESRHEKYGSSEEVAWYYFTGKKSDDESGLIYFGARYYDPKLGRFISPDTMVQSSDNPQTFNRYTYAGNNPVNLIDPSGHWFFAAIFALIKAYAIAHPIIAGAIAGGVLGGANAAISGTNIAQGIGLGVLGGAIGGGVGLGVGSFLEKGLGTFAAGMIGAGLGGATAGAATLAILGGNVGMGALAGLAGGVISFAGGRAWSLGADAVAGGVSSVIQGGEFGEGAKFGAIDNALTRMMDLVMPTEGTVGSQEKQPGDLVFIKPGKMDLVGWGISFFEGGAFSHVGIVVDNQNMVSAGPKPGVGYQTLKAYDNRQGVVVQKFRGNQNVINAAKNLAVAKPPIRYNYVFFGRGLVCSTTCGNAISVGAGIPWTGIGPNSQYNVFKSYGE